MNDVGETFSLLEVITSTAGENLQIFENISSIQDPSPRNAEIQVVPGHTRTLLSEGPLATLETLKCLYLVILCGQRELSSGKILKYVAIP